MKDFCTRYNTAFNGNILLSSLDFSQVLYPSIFFHSSSKLIMHYPIKGTKKIVPFLILPSPSSQNIWSCQDMETLQPHPRDWARVLKSSSSSGREAAGIDQSEAVNLRGRQSSPITWTEQPVMPITVKSLIARMDSFMLGPKSQASITFFRR